MDELFRSETNRHCAQVMQEIERHLGHGYLIDVDAHHKIKAAVRRAGGKCPDFLHFGSRIRPLDLKATLDHVNPLQISKENTRNILLRCSDELEPIFKLAA